MPRCKYCQEHGVVKKYRKWICKEHFNQFYFNRIKKVLKKVPIKNKKILVAISGGKDSISILHALNALKVKYKYKIEAIFLNLGIDEFSSISLEYSKELCNHLEIKLNIFNLQENFDISIDNLTSITKKVCSYCGTIKRYILNKFAYENNFDFLITGHNMDDEVIFLKQNILGGSIEYVKRYSFYYTETLPDLKLIGKIKPQFFLSENDNLDYCKINSLKFVTLTCPYSDKSPHKVLEEGINLFNKKMDYSYNFLNFFLKINKFLPDLSNEDSFTFCKQCGFPTTNYEMCKFCKIILSVKEKVTGKKVKNS